MSNFFDTFCNSIRSMIQPIQNGDVSKKETDNDNNRNINNITSCFTMEEMNRLSLLHRDMTTSSGGGDGASSWTLLLDEFEKYSPTRTTATLTVHAFFRVLFDTTTNNREKEEEEDVLEMDDYLNGMAVCLGRKGTRDTIKILFDCCYFASDANNANEEEEEESSRFVDGKEFVSLCHSFGVAAHGMSLHHDDKNNIDNSHPNDQSVEAVDVMLKSLLDYTNTLRKLRLEQMDMINSLHNNSSTTEQQQQQEKDGMVSLNEITTWHDKVFPLLMEFSVVSFMTQLVFDSTVTTRRSLLSSVGNQASAFFDVRNNNDNDKQLMNPWLFVFGCMSPSLGGKWHRIFSTDSDGLSFNRLHRSLTGYAGPTLLILRDTTSDNNLFGAYTSCAWKDSHDFFGSRDCFLFQLSPTTKVYPPSKQNIKKNYMYCNSSDMKKKQKEVTYGIGFGGTKRKPRLYLSETFDDCVAHAFDSTFEDGPIMADHKGNDFDSPIKSYNFDVDCLEVWGVGSEDVIRNALKLQNKHREIADSHVRKAQTVDRAQFLDDFNSGLIESKAFGHRDQVRGRAEKCYDEDEHRK